MTTSSRPSIVVGVDGTPLSLEALAKALPFAQHNNAKVVVVYVRYFETPLADPATGAATIGMLEEAIDEIAESARSGSEAVIAPTGLDHEFVVRDGEPGYEIIEVAHHYNADWIVVGASIHGALSGFLLSSVASHLLHHSDVSVAIVRPPREPA